MAFSLIQSTIFLKKFSQSYAILRYLRGTRRGDEPKLVKGSVKNVYRTQLEEYEVSENYRDFVQKVKSSAHINDVEIEEALNSGEDVGTAIGSLARPNERDKFLDKDHKAFVKKQIIKRKYFKTEIESTLLTNAAKNQIRHLHRIDPVQWNPENLSQSFPVTINGVKKLLKSNFVLRSPERIRQHDAEVAERWACLKSRTPSPLISPYTRRMWDEEKIMKENYNGDPNLPNVPPESGKVVIHQEEKEVGEFSSIIQQYIEYKKSKESGLVSESTSDELIISDGLKHSGKDRKKSLNLLRSSKYHMDDETDDTDYITNTFRPFSKNNYRQNSEEMIHSQFKENLKEEVSNSKHKPDGRYVQWMQDQTEEKENLRMPPKPVDSKKVFSKIPKFKRDQTIELKEDQSKNVYYYDDKMGYQHPTGKPVQSKIRLPNKLRKEGAVYKVGRAVYDEDGELLYKVPGK
ncbi:hypothetical protein JTE90_011347 [Oedothorax gibbosus]|uniref:Neugrin n=1 Tax=Oedothorax gibbosus TaxID=931172 RepID=A0AAV6VKJ4_9ARAC|nr:hypothetical protein JTE90_011347 [Oedothorax gibbosus]